MAKKLINIALQGGGAHGALAWGILDKLLEDGRVKFDAISATSAGAMNAAVLAHGLLEGGNDGAREALHNFWKKISDVGELYSPIKSTPLETYLGVKSEQSLAFLWFDFLSKILTPAQLNPFDFNPLRDVLEENIDFDRINASEALKIFISATNVRTGKIKIFENKELSVAAIMASACLPFVFPAVRVDDDYFWDGGYMGNPALYPLIYHSECPDILIVHISPIYREQVPDTATDILNRMSEISFNSSLMREMRAVAFVSKLLKDGWIKDEYLQAMKQVFVHAIRADVTMQVYSVASKLNPSWEFIKELYKEGRKEGEKWLKESFRHVGKKSSIEIGEYL